MYHFKLASFKETMRFFFASEQFVPALPESVSEAMTRLGSGWPWLGSCVGQRLGSGQFPRWQLEC